MNDNDPVGSPVPFVRYDEAGEVVEWGVMSSKVIAAQREQGQRVLPGGDGKPPGILGGDNKSPAVYVCLKRNKVKLKLGNPTRLEGMSLLNVPKPSIVTINRVDYVVTDGKVELAFEFPGTYRVDVHSVKHLPASFEVTA